MVSAFGLIEARMNRLIRELIEDGTAVRELNAALLALTLRRWHEEVGEQLLRHVLTCEINQIDEGAYRPYFVAPEARMIDDEEARERRSALTVVEGGGGSKV